MSFVEGLLIGFAVGWTALAALFYWLFAWGQNSPRGGTR